MNVLMLHDIRVKRRDFFYNRYALPYFLEPFQFDNIINNIKNSKSRILSPRDVLESNTILNPNNYLLTFDDGLIDHYDVAKLLFEKNICAFFFIPVFPILEGKIIDTHKLQFILSEVKPEVIIQTIKKLFSEYYSSMDFDWSIYYKSKWRTNIWPEEMVFITRVLREVGNFEWRNLVIENLFQKYISDDEIDFCSNFYMNLAHIKELIQMGHTIGGHGYYSTDMRFDSNFRITDEISKSKEFLNNIGILDFLSFSYPNGGFNDFVKEELSKNSFDVAFATQEKSVSSLESLFEIPRIDPSKTKLIL